MKKQILLLFYLISFSFCKEPKIFGTDVTFIMLSEGEIKIIGEGVNVSGTKITINKSGAYLVQGSKIEANIVIKSSSVNLFLQNLEFSSSKTAPITVDDNLKDIKITNIQDTIINDWENPLTTEGECAVIKIKKNSKVTFENQGEFTMNGYCKNIIKGGSEVPIVFEKSNGHYIINANQTAISTDGYLEFNGGFFNIYSGEDAIKCSPEGKSNGNTGKILINDGNFYIESNNDAFTATNNIHIVNGTFNIKTEKGYDSKTFDSDSESAKGFKLTNNATGCEIKIDNGEFYLNTADDAFHSKGDLKILKGKYIIFSGDDGIHSGLNLVLGEKGASLENLYLNILHSYEALEGMTITIYSGKINITAEDDGINGAGGDGGDGPGPGPGPGPRPGPRPDPRNDSDDDWPPKPPPRNDSDDDWPFPPGGRGNASYKISIHGGEIYVYCDGDGLDTNGNIFIHGGNLNVFSQGNRDNEPIDHDGNFTLFNGEVLGVGSKGMEKIHDGIKKGNEMYAYYDKAITKNKKLKIKNETNVIVKEGNITKDINYIFYSSLKLNEKYKFYIYDENNTESELVFTFGRPAGGEDDEEDKKDDGDDKQPDSYSNKLQISILGILLLLILL